jgi:hypothetical protein
MVIQAEQVVAVIIQQEAVELEVQVLNTLIREAPKKEKHTAEMVFKLIG